MKVSYCLLAYFLLCSCSLQNRDVDREAVEDYIRVQDLQEVDVIRTRGNLPGDISRYLNDYHLSYKTKQRYYLIAFAHVCPRRYGTVTTDERNNNLLQAHADSIRGCRISRIYEMTKENAAELRTLGRPPATPR